LGERNVVKEGAARSRENPQRVKNSSSKEEEKGEGKVSKREKAPSSRKKRGKKR